MGSLGDVALGSGTHDGAPAWFLAAPDGDTGAWTDAARKVLAARLGGAREAVETPAGLWIDPPAGSSLSSHADDGIRRSLADVQAVGSALLARVAEAGAAGVGASGLVPEAVFVHGRSVSLLLPAPSPAKAAVIAPPEWPASPPDARSEVFAIGVCLYLLAVGRPAFTGAPDEVRAAVVAGRFRRPRHRRPDLPEALDRAIAASLEPDPTRRPPDLAALAAMWRGEEPSWAQAPGLLMLDETPPPAHTAPPPPQRVDVSRDDDDVDVVAGGSNTMIPLPETVGPPRRATGELTFGAPATPPPAPAPELVVAVPTANRPAATPPGASPSMVPAAEPTSSGSWRWVAAAAVVILLVAGGGAVVALGVGGGAVVVASGAGDVPTTLPPPAPPVAPVVAPVTPVDVVVPIEPDPPADAAPVEVAATDLPGAAFDPQRPRRRRDREPAGDPAGGVAVGPGPADAVAPEPQPEPEPAPEPDAVAAVDPAPEPERPTPAPAAVTPSPAPSSGIPSVHRSSLTFKLSPKPVYPDGQRDAGEVTCLATVVVDPKGWPQSVAVDRCAPAFADAARAALMRARFAPPMVDGVNTTVSTILPVKFTPR